jgi:molecular chaperone GrpE
MDKKNNVPEKEDKEINQKDTVVDSNNDKQILKYEKDISELKDLFARESAENENLRKRHKKELEDAHKFSITSFAKSLIDQVEDLFRALENVDKGMCESNKDFKILFDGVEMTKNNLLKTLETFAIERIYPLNQPFDHNLHEAVSKAEDKSKKPNTVINVIQAGYLINNRLLRPAMVIVSKLPE